MGLYWREAAEIGLETADRTIASQEQRAERSKCTLAICLLSSSLRRLCIIQNPSIGHGAAHSGLLCGSSYTDYWSK